MSNPFEGLKSSALVEDVATGEKSVITGPIAGRSAPSSPPEAHPFAPAPPPPPAILEFFAFAHLPQHLQDVSRPICELAELMVTTLPPSAELSAGLRKLLEAKDCFVRSRVARK